MPLAYYPRTPAGAILSRFSGDVVGLEGALVSLISWLVLPSLEVVYATALMFWFSVWLGLLGVLVFPLILWGPRLFAARALALGYEKRRSEAELLNIVQENVGAQAVVKAFGLERHARDQLARFGTRWSSLAFRFNLFSFLVERSASTGVYVLHLLIFGLGAYWVFAGRLSLGTFVAFEGMFLSMGEALTYVTQFVPTLAQAAGSARHIDEIFAEKPDVVDSIDAVIAPRLAQEIAFESVWLLEYSPGSFRLENFRVRIPRGSHVALAGASGSGKSTILNLLLRLYDPITGAILIDGRDLRSVTQASLRAQIGIVFQDSVLFHTSILENIRLGNNGVSQWSRSSRPPGPPRSTALSFLCRPAMKRRSGNGAVNSGRLAASGSRSARSPWSATLRSHPRRGQLPRWTTPPKPHSSPRCGPSPGVAQSFR